MPDTYVAGIPVTTCRSCGARIVFARHWAATTSRLMPIDAEPSAGGRILIHEDRTYEIIGTVEAIQEHAGELHSSHFATCTDPIRWRVK